MPEQQLESILELSCFHLDHESDVVVARHHCRLLALRHGFEEVAASEIALAASELGHNIVKYASPGTVCFRVLAGPPLSFEVTAEDKGKGIPDVARAMLDGNSEAGPLVHESGFVRRQDLGLGLGLGTVGRVMDSMVIESEPGQGTRVIAVKQLNAKTVRDQAQ